MKPATPLPWEQIPWTPDECEDLIDETDVRYMVHAANAYPRLVKAVRELVYGSGSPFCPIQKAKKLLNKLGEFQE